jgi:hypothetical protein
MAARADHSMSVDELTNTFYCALTIRAAEALRLAALRVSCA